MKLRTFRFPAFKTFALAGMICLLWAAAAHADFGKSGWIIFKKSQTSTFRSIAAVSPAPDNLAGSLFNPALLGSLNQVQILSTGELGSSEDKFGGILLGLPWDNSALAAGLMYFDAGTMDLNWLEGSQLQTETVAAQKDFLGFVSYGYSLGEKFRAGLSLKIARSELVQRQAAVAVTADAGLFYQPLKGWTLSLSLNHLGGATPFVDEQAPLPSSLYAGSGYWYQANNWHTLLGVGVLYNWADEKILPEAGVEFGYSLISLNAGYRLGVEEAKLHFGLGLDWQNIQVQYAYEPGVYLDATHRLSLGYRFGMAANPAKAKPSLMPVRPAAKNESREISAAASKTHSRLHVPKQPPLATQMRSKKASPSKNLQTPAAGD